MHMAGDTPQLECVFANNSVIITPARMRLLQNLERLSFPRNLGLRQLAYIVLGECPDNLITA